MVRIFEVSRDLGMNAALTYSTEDSSDTERAKNFIGLEDNHENFKKNVNSLFNRRCRRPHRLCRGC